jgi:hypothetical protein
MKPTLKRCGKLSKNGFALIVTLSLMILLTVIAVGLLSLSSISLRASSSSMAMAEARSNAQLSIQLALGQLQLTTGQDTRITASSGVIDPSKPPVTGAWRSWEGADHDVTGKPVVPDYGSKKLPGNPSDLPGTPATGRFLGWLTSTAAATSPAVNQFPDLANKVTTGFVPMVSTGSVTDPNRQVYMKPTPVGASKGSLAWWTSGENSKAMINTDRVAKPTGPVAWQQRVRSNGRADAKSFGLENVDTYALGKTVPTTGNLKLVNPVAELKKVHDLTAVSRGLLTNTATGGWRRDFSLFSERFSSLPSSNLPLFTLQPGKVQTYSKAPASGNATRPVIYPWAGYRNNANGASWEQVPPISSWTALVDYMLQYKKLSTSSASRTAMPVFSGGTNTSRFDFVDTVRRMPQIARIQWIYSLCSDKASSPPDPAKPYRAGLMITPVLTLWNPYNVELAFNNIEVKIQQTTPLRFRFKVAGVVLQDSTLADITKTDINSYHTFIIKIPSGTLRPGQTRIYGLNDPTPKRDSQAGNINLTQGYRPNGGFMFFGINQRADVYAAAADTFAVDRVMYDGITQESGRDGAQKTGIGIIFDMVSDGKSSSHRMIYNVPELGGDQVATALYPPLTAANLPSSSTIASVEGIKNLPFASAVFAYRMASPMSRDTAKHKHLYTKGMLQANPLCSYTEIGFGDDSNAVNSMKGAGVYHPVNAPYDFAFQDVLGWNDNLAIPEYEKATNSSYIVSGMASGDGLTRCVMAEIPTRPLQSLADLQHFDARGNNPIPPFQFNLIGNGSANPIFAPDQVSVSTSFNNGMCNDDTFILNHLLFDDWFVSSIAPDLQDYSKNSKRSLTSVYQDHLELKTPLPNRSYLPSRDAAEVAGKVDVSQAVSNANSTAKDGKTGMYSFESIASKFEVEGMFNINSTSLEAWKSLLRQSRDAEVPYLAANGNTKAGQAASYSYPRTSIAGDLGSDSGSGESNASFPQAVEFAGHRVLTDEQIDVLADEIVKQIQQRGPFLSLSEFVNRQLNASNKNLAIASTIQKALDNLADMRNNPKNPFNALQNNSVEITDLPAGTTHDYKFPEAALGWSAFGVPGWIRQADILRPVAPILSARDDTFTIRGYGDSRDKSNKVVARAWCEVVVQRKADYLDPADPAAVAPGSTKMTSATNKRFGRRYDVVSFRWLDEKEI